MTGIGSAGSSEVSRPVERAAFFTGTAAVAIPGISTAQTINAKPCRVFMSPPFAVDGLIDSESRIHTRRQQRRIPSAQLPAAGPPPVPRLPLVRRCGDVVVAAVGKGRRQRVRDGFVVPDMRRRGRVP